MNYSVLVVTGLMVYLSKLVQKLITIRKVDMSLSLELLNVFVASADSGSFSQAARNMGKTQSSISMAVSTLEDNLGVELFDRTTRKPKLTDAGRTLLVKARHLVRDAKNFEADALLLAGHERKELIVAVEYVLPNEILFNALSYLEQIYPKIPITVFQSGLNDIAELVVTEKVDIGIGHVGLLTSNTRLEESAITIIHFTEVAACTHPLAQKELITKQEISQYRQLVVTDRSNMASDSVSSVFTPNVWLTNDLNLKLEMIIAGKGWGRMPIHMVEPHIKSGKLVKLNTDFLSKRTRGFPLHAMWLQGKPVDNIQKVLVDTLKEQSNDYFSER